MRFYFSKNHPHKCVAPTPAGSLPLLAQKSLHDMHYLSAMISELSYLRRVNCGGDFLVRLKYARFSVFLVYRRPTINIGRGAPEREDKKNRSNRKNRKNRKNKKDKECRNSCFSCYSCHSPLFTGIFFDTREQGAL